MGRVDSHETLNRNAMQCNSMSFYFNSQHTCSSSPTRYMEGNMYEPTGVHKVFAPTSGAESSVLASVGSK